MYGRQTFWCRTIAPAEFPFKYFFFTFSFSFSFETGLGWNLLHRLGWPQTHKDICLPLPPKCWNKGVCHHAQPTFLFIYYVCVDMCMGTYIPQYAVPSQKMLCGKVFLGKHNTHVYSSQIGNPWRIKLMILPKSSLVNQWVFIGVTYKK